MGQTQRVCSGEEIPHKKDRNLEEAKKNSSVRGVQSTVGAFAVPF